MTLVAQAGYDDTWQKYTAGLTNGQLPDVVQLEDVRTQAGHRHRFVPPRPVLHERREVLDPRLPGPTAGLLEGQRGPGALPFAVSAPSCTSTRSPSQRPAEPGRPADHAARDGRRRQGAQGLGQRDGPELDPWHLETWLATANQLFVNNQNGRTARATKAAFNSATGLQIFTDLVQLVRSGDATTNPSSGASEYDNLLGIGSGKYGMTVDSSADLGTISQVLSSGQYPNVQLGIGSFPVLSSSIQGGIEPGGSGVYISNKVPAVQQAAAWQYMHWSTTRQSQATWAAGTGYIPVRKSSARRPPSSTCGP